MHTFLMLSDKAKRTVACMLTMLMFAWVAEPAVILADESSTTPTTVVTDASTTETTISGSATSSADTVSAVDTAATTTAATTSPINLSADLTASSTTATSTDATSIDITATSIASTDSTASTTATSTDVTVSASASSTDTSITTGSATAITDVTNTVNTNIVNSTGTIMFLSSTSTDPGDIDLSRILDNLPHSSGGGLPVSPSDASAASSTVVTDSEAISDINVSTTTNDITLIASSGGNAITDASGTASITTGTSTAVANLANLVNTNIIDSNYLLFFVTKVGDLVGNIVLPPLEALINFFAPQGDSPSLVVNGSGATALTVTTTIDNANTATIENNLNLGATTGSNSATGTSTSITTGNARADASIINVANTNIVGAPAFGLELNVLGTWSGNVLGLPDFITASTTDHGVDLFFLPAFFNASKSSLMPFAFSGGSLTDSNLITNDNDATITNNVRLLADTGGNTLDGNGTITTGNAEASACITNVANTNIIRSSVLMGVICVLGNFYGNVSFGSTTPTSTPPEITPTTTPPTETGEGGNPGGGGGGGGGGIPSPAIGIVKSNSAHGTVYPGSTVTYTVTVTNTSTLPIVNGHLTDVLAAPDGSTVTTNDWDLARIDPGEEVTLHYDVIFDPSAPSGVYPNTATVTGQDTNGVEVTASAMSNVIVGLGGGGIIPGVPNSGAGILGVGGSAFPGFSGLGGEESEFPGPPNTGFAPTDIQ